MQDVHSQEDPSAFSGDMSRQSTVVTFKSHSIAVREALTPLAAKRPRVLGTPVAANEGGGRRRDGATIDIAGDARLENIVQRTAKTRLDRKRGMCS